MNNIHSVLPKLLFLTIVFFLASCDMQNGTKKSCNHEYIDEIKTAPTCLLEGEKTLTCKLCGDKKSEVIPALGHDLIENVVSEATCEKDGLKEIHCSHDGCDYHEESKIEHTGHSIYNEKKDDKYHYVKCFNCELNEVEEHSFDNGVITANPTHMSEGNKKYTCTKCMFVKNESIPKLVDHVYGDYSYLDEEKHVRTCLCGETDEGSHVWDEGRTTLEATHLRDGEKTYKCIYCNGTKIEIIPKITEHSYGSWTKLDENEHIKTCECGASITESHEFDEGTFIPSNDLSSGGKIVYSCQKCDYKKEVITSGYELINRFVFKDLTGTEVDDTLYPFSDESIERPIYSTSFMTNGYYDFNNVDLSRYSEVFFYYKEISTTYPAIVDESKNVKYFDMSTSIGTSDWLKFTLSYNEDNNAWNITSSFLNIDGLEINDLSKFKFQTGGSTPKLELSPLFGKLTLKHTLKEHTLTDSGYELIERMPININIDTYEIDTILADKITTFSNYLDAKNQIGNLEFKNIDEDKYDELKFYFSSLRDNKESCYWTEVGLKTDTSVYSVYSSNSITWNEIKLIRNESSKFFVYANDVYKCEISSLQDLKVRVFKKQLISGLYGKVTSTRLMLANEQGTNYKIVYHSDDSRFGKHSAELLGRILNSAIGRNIFIVSSTTTKPLSSDFLICVGTKMAQLAGIDYSDVKGLNYKFTTQGNCIFIFGDTNFGTNNGVKHFLKETVGYEYYYKGVETFNNVSKIMFSKIEKVSNTSFLVGYDVNAETRSDAGYSWNKDFSYSIDTGLVGDGAAGNYGVYGGWHNEVKCAEAKGITLYQNSIRTNPQKHMDLSSEENATKVASWLNENYYSKGNENAMFCLMDDYSWYNTSDKQENYSSIYFEFINKVAENLDLIVNKPVSLVAVSYHQTFPCPTNWVPYKGKYVNIKIYVSPSEIVFASTPNSKFNQAEIKMQDDNNDTPTLSFSPYNELTKWVNLIKTYELGSYVFLYDSLPNYFAPLETVEYMLDYYKLFKEMGSEKLYDMGQYDNGNATDWSRLKTYLKGKLTDNCDISKEEFNTLVNNFFDAYYQDASSYMKNAYDLELETITNPVNPGTNDYDRYYGKKHDRNFPLYLRGYYYNKKYFGSFPEVTFFENKSKTGIMDYYDKALEAVNGNEVLTNRIKLDGLALRYWYWGCNDSSSGLYGSGSSFGYKNYRQETFEQIIIDAKKLGVTQWGEGNNFTIDNAVKG